MSEKYISRSPAIAARVLDDEVMIMSVTDSKLFTLDSVARCIWEAADGRTSLSEIVERRVCTQFEVDPQTAYRDAEEFVDALAEHGILKVSEKPQIETESTGVLP
jgi:Coenzyme PQQ synthesis protein D (PqqD)